MCANGHTIERKPEAGNKPVNGCMSVALNMENRVAFLVMTPAASASNGLTGGGHFVGPPSYKSTLVSGCLLLSFLCCFHSHPFLQRVNIRPCTCALGWAWGGAFRVSGFLERITCISDANKPHAHCGDEPSLSGAGACRQTLPAPPIPRPLRR